MMKIRNLAFTSEKFRSVKYPCNISLQRKVNLCQKDIVSVMFSFRLISKEYRAVARRMDRHRRHFTLRPYQACLSGSFGRNLNSHIAFSPVRYSLSRSLSWNS
ncbi:hypothetical protein CEP66_24700 [Citrobacter koseri]|nr:hypothetical protein AM352_13860 [Citrobacter koseri]AVE68875.1 hypothetical protein AM351_14150 [Citrobacter koseri]AVK74033.1 hypothetical protein CEP66_24700 [Citrobacter koseri]PNN16252.1 hypothetical protein AL526_001905 [Citrobacter koseri]PNO81272.1 hypothetical protein MC77_021270 [Citrobacter koseri]